MPVYVKNQNVCLIIKKELESNNIPITISFFQTIIDDYEIRSS
jgi:hypothetical protein